jgi:diadenosine tetraphosphate (Ap4A) HIT family hydrolase
MTINATIEKFGYPGTLIAEYLHWLVLLRPDQPTLGSLVLAARGEERSFAALPPAAFAELRTAVSDIETALAAAIGCERINYLMLMMVDPHVHWHVIPRYEGAREQAGLVFRDAGWPKVPQLAEAVSLDAEGIAALGAWLRAHWPAGG